MLGQLLQHVGEPAVVERGGHLVAPGVRQVLQRIRHVGRAHLVQQGDQVRRALGVGRTDQAADPVIFHLVDVAATGQPAGVLTDRDPADHPLGVPVQLHADVQDDALMLVGAGLLGLHDDPAIQQILQDEQLVRPFLEPAQVQ